MARSVTTKHSIVKRKNRHLTLEEAKQVLEVLTPILGKPQFNDVMKKAVGKKVSRYSKTGFTNVYEDNGYRSLKWYAEYHVAEQAAKVMERLELGYYFAPRNLAAFRIIVPKEFNVAQWYKEQNGLEDMLEEAKARDEAAYDEHAPEWLRVGRQMWQDRNKG